MQSALSLLFPAAVLAASLVAQDVRELSTPVGQQNHIGVTAATIDNAIAGGWRLVDIEYRGVVAGNATFDAVLVQNAGAYAINTWWYHDKTAAQVGNLLTANSARLIDLEPWDAGGGNVRFTCIMVDNTGANARTWWWYHGTTTAAINNSATANNARIVDLEEYTVGAGTFFSAVMIRNAGADARTWWWYVDVTAAQLNGLLTTNQARIYDLGPRGNGNFNVVMIRDPQPVAWYWWYGVDSGQILALINNFGVRAIDLETYVAGGVRRWAIAAINNSNALTTDIGNRMRNATNGTVGAWMQRITGANLVYLNGDAPFEPASTMKTLHLVHAMRRVQLAAVTLATAINVFTGTVGSCPQDTGAINETLQVVLEKMMRQSDNNRTQAITAYFGQANINATAAALGMTRTSLNHRIGCGAQAIANPNRISLRDLHTLHQQVAGGYLGAWRTNFYDIMLHAVTDLGLATVIDQEAAAIGGFTAAQRTTFKQLTQMAHKGGNYGLSSGGPAFFHRCEFGWLSLPFVANGALAPREYAFGAFVNNASVDANAQAAIYTHALPEMFRPEVRAALLTWTANFAASVSVGAGCGTGPHALAAAALPRINSAAAFTSTGGFPGRLGVLGIGFSDTVWAGRRLPASLVPFGAAAGCSAFSDVVSTLVGTANAGGQASFSINIPLNATLLGTVFYTQSYSFGPISFVSSNGRRNQIGF